MKSFFLNQVADPQSHLAFNKIHIPVIFPRDMSVVNNSIKSFGLFSLQTIERLFEFPAHKRRIESKVELKRTNGLRHFYLRLSMPLQTVKLLLNCYFIFARYLHRRDL